MPSFFEHVAARLAHIHAKRVYARFVRALGDVDREQAAVLRRVLAQMADSDFGRRHGLRGVRTLEDLRRSVPLMTYEEYRPYIDRVSDGDTPALFAPGTRILMFATSSGTTAQPKRIPVTPAFVADYRRGWNIFGLKMLTDHPRAILRAILQSSARHDASVTPSGIPCGAITGLLARTQKRIVRRFYVGRPEVAYLDDPRARYYTLVRLGIVRDVAFAITASPATLIQMARTTDEESETLIRDVRDGTLSDRVVADTTLRRVLSADLRPNQARAVELSRLRSTHGALRPRDYWRIEFLACWTGGTMGYYLERLADWWGSVPVRDIGLLASEGRISIPLQDGEPTGVLDITSGVFEFVPIEDAEAAVPRTLTYREVEAGHDYVVALTNTSGLVRYRLDDVVRVHGKFKDTPIIEFLRRAGRVASVAGEKLTENQVVAAVRAATATVGIPECDFIVAPCWDDPPYYRLTCDCSLPATTALAVDAALSDQNEEYASRRKSNRLGPLRVRGIEQSDFVAMDRRLMATRKSSAEQYKRPCLFTEPGADDRALGA